MDTDYDRIAEQYKRARPQPWRTHIERYTLLRLSGDVAGKTVIDLACGEGYYARALRQQGAARVVGVHPVTSATLSGRVVSPGENRSSGTLSTAG